MSFFACPSPSPGHLRALTHRVAYVLPVSDDGGSTAEIVRVLGGPAVGDIRSRCLRLADESDEEVGRATCGSSHDVLCAHVIHFLHVYGMYAWWQSLTRS